MSPLGRERRDRSGSPCTDRCPDPVFVLVGLGVRVEAKRTSIRVGWPRRVEGFGGLGVQGLWV